MKKDINELILNKKYEKAEKLLKWKAVLKFNEITSITSSWYQNYLNNKNNEASSKLKI